MNYQQTLDYIYSFIDSERKLLRTPAEYNLPRTTALLRTFGEPQHAFRSVVIAGTKGKGSTAAMLESILRHAGLRTGLWTSPHLHSYRERIQVNRQLISQADLVDLVARSRPDLERLDPEHLQQLTTFELGFGLALRYFAEQQVDIAVLEVGLGGRYDSANSVTPILSLITSISYDHMHVLGGTLTRIAHDKAGILKPGVPALTVPQDPEALEEIVRVAAEVGTPLQIVGESVAALQAEGVAAESASAAELLPDSPPAAPTPVTLFNPTTRYRGPLYTTLRGHFQRENALLATGAALLLRDGGLAVSDSAIADGLKTAHWPGRLEVVDGTPPIVLDGAHNGDSARKLIESLRDTYPGRRLVLVFGTMRDKDISRMMPELLPEARALILTRSRHPRAFDDLDDLAQQAQPWLAHHNAPVPLIHTDDVPEALAEARRLATATDLICVTGSLIVVAAAREALGLPNEKD